MQFIDPYHNYVFASEKIFVGQKSRLPAAGKIFRGLGEKRGGSETKNECSDALREPVQKDLLRGCKVSVTAGVFSTTTFECNSFVVLHFPKWLFLHVTKM